MDFLDNIPEFSYRFLPTDKCHLLHLSGKLLSAFEAKEMLEELEQHVCPDSQLIVDLSELDMLSSEGLNVLLRLLTLYRKHNGDITLCAPNQHLKELFIMTRIDSIFSLSESTDQALTACNSQKKPANA